MPDQTLYTANVHVTGGREGTARSSDGRLDLKLSTPGGAGTGTNPEQLFAAGWSACFEGAMAIAAKRMNVALPADPVIDAEVELCAGDNGYFLRARLNIGLPGVDSEAARTLVEAAHQTCPYSKAVAGNIEAEIKLV